MFKFRHGTAKPASDAELTKFWNSLRGMKPENGFLNFHVRSSLLPKTMKKLYIRKAYEDLFTIICKNLEEKDIEKRLTGMAITGTPGIGKSMFLFYILWRLANMETKRTVIIHRQIERGGIYVFQDSGCWVTFNYRRYAGFLKDEDLYWYLTDALEPPPARVEAVTILVSSPARKYYSTFLPLSHVAPLYYLPIWSLEELQLVAPIYSRSPKIVEKRFARIGGIPRYVLEKNAKLKENNKDSFTRHKHENFRRLTFDGLVNNEEISNLIVHFEVAANYSSFTMKFASTYVAGIAFKFYLFYQREELERLLLSGGSSPFFGSFRGDLFEKYVHQVLSVGGKFNGRSLDDDGECELVLPKQPIRGFYNLSECTEKNVYYMALYHNHACIDSMVVDKGYFQITMAKYHPTSGILMEKIMNQMKLIDFYFVVPDLLFEDFRKQKFEKIEIGQNSIKQGSPVEGGIIKEEVIQGQTSMKRPSNSIDDSNENKKQKIDNVENEGGLTIDFLRQYVICIPIKEQWNNLCLVLKASYGITAEEERKMLTDVDYGIHVIFDDGEEEEEESEEKKEVNKKKA